MENKRIWITTDWEVSPLMDGSKQLGRMNCLAQYLSSQGYKVTLWFTTFSHPEKRYIYNETKIVDVNENLRIVALHSPIGYKKNTSPQRFIHHSCLARKMKKMINDINEFPKPDLIFCSYPIEQFCRVALEYGKQNHVPVIMDARDQWPDIFERAFPNSLQKIAKAALWPMKRKTAKDFSDATAICAMSPIMLEWGLNYARREKSDLDDYVFIGCEKKGVSDEILLKGIDEWKELGVTEDTWNICFFSSLSRTAIDLDTVIEAVRRIFQTHPEIRLIIGGKGDEETRLREKTKNDSYIHMMGWMNQDQMNSLMSISKIGLLCYRNTPDFKDGWGNKVGQYLSFGLPIATSAQGFAKTYTDQYECGFSYGEKDVFELEQKLIYLIKNPKEQIRLSQNALARFESEFAGEVVMKKFETMILDVCNKYEKEKGKLK